MKKYNKINGNLFTENLCVCYISRDNLYTLRKNFPNWIKVHAHNKFFISGANVFVSVP